MTAAERSIEYIGRQRLPGSEILAGLVDKFDLELAVAVLPEGLDPADFIEQHGADGFAELVASAAPLVNFLIDRIIEKYWTRAGGTANPAAEAARLISRVPGPVAQEEYMRYLADKLDIPYTTLTQEIAGARLRADGRGGAGPEGAGPRAQKKATASAERELVKLILRYPEKAPALDELGVALWEDAQLKQVATVLKSQVTGKAKSGADILRKVDPGLQDLVSELLIEALPAADAEDYFGEIFLKLKELTVERQIDMLRKRLDKTSAEKKEYDDIFAELMSLEYKRRELKDQAVNGGFLWVKS